MIYLDTSFLIPYYLAEANSEGPAALHLAIVERHGETLHTLDRRLLACAAALRIPATDAGIRIAVPFGLAPPSKPWHRFPARFSNRRGAEPYAR